jgi:hypothetical protein
MGVGRDAEDFDAELLEFLVMFGEVFEFGGANEGEISRVEEKNRPGVLDAFLGHFNEFAAFEGLGFERLDLRVDERHFLLRCFGRRSDDRRANSSVSGN